MVACSLNAWATPIDIFWSCSVELFCGLISRWRTSPAVSTASPELVGWGGIEIGDRDDSTATER